MLSPFAYSQKETVGAFNDEEHLLVRGKDKLSVKDWIERVGQEVDAVVVPVEQVTPESGKKKRKRAVKMSLKQTKMIVKRERQYALISSVTLGDEKGLYNYEIREYIKEIVQDE